MVSAGAVRVWGGYTEQGQLAKWLVENSCADRVFFCNSGGEANEAAIKVCEKIVKLSNCVLPH